MQNARYTQFQVDHISGSSPLWNWTISCNYSTL